MSSVRTDTPAALGYRMPAEWDRHESIWLAWPHDEKTFETRLPVVEEAYLDLIHAIHVSETVELLVPSELVAQKVLARLRTRRTDLSRIHMHVTTYADVWIRDYGPTFVVNGARRTLAMVHWQFNAWGGKYEELIPDTVIPEVLNVQLGLPRFTPGIVLEGGSIDVNGVGSVLTTEQCLLHRNRNPTLNQRAVEDLLGEYLDARHVIWLGEGIVGDDTDGHIDDIARFVDPRTVLCAIEEDSSDENYAILKDNYRRLELAVDQDQRPLTVISLPMPGRVGDATGRLPASYANFYIGNTVVLMPTFGHPNDAKALAILQGVFPSRSVAGIPAQDLVYGLGTIHCISQQQPAV